MVGTLGSAADRFAVLTPSASSLPSRTLGNAAEMGEKKYVTLPAMVSVSASGVPLYGMWSTSMPAASLNFSALIWVPLPVPAEPKFSCPGFCLASAISSATDLTPTVGATTSTFGCPASGTTSTKSFAVSKDRLV